MTAPTPHLPERIAVLDAHADEKSAVPHLLADLCEAYRVYERLSARDAEASGEKPLPATELVRLRLISEGSIAYERPAEPTVPCDGNANPPAPTAVHDGSARSALPACDAALISCDAGGPGGAEIVRRLAPALSRLAPGVCVYLLCDVASSDAAPARGLFSALEQACEARGLAWMGGAAVLERTFADAVRASARMGMMRRPVSEGIDGLILALRSGLPAGELVIKPHVPRFVQALAIRRARGRGA